MDKKYKNKLLCAAVVGIMGAALSSTPVEASGSKKSSGGKVKCLGVNSCKGKGTCGFTHPKTGKKTTCGGKNGCKGQGIVMMPEKECKAKKGKVVS